ncbi:MAG TPA: hypothetical protein VFA65_16785 [Bryobacteraceae bacterium]|nr:hypothetical protein [Bryobacteraceae bacterium]
MSLIRGVLLAGRFRNQRELNGMSDEDQRNTLIVELAGRTNQSVPHFQAMDNAALAGTGAVLVFLRTTQIRTDEELKRMSDDDQRNTLIVEIGAQTGLGKELQALSNMELVLMGLGKPRPGQLKVGTFIRGVLAAGPFRTQHELNQMSDDDQRNTLIVELAHRTNQSIGHFQAMNDAMLAGAGAAVVFLSKGAIRTDDQLKTMSDDDQRNTLIVEVAAQTGLGSKLQALSTMDIVLTGLGVVPNFPVKKPSHYVFRVDSVDILRQKTDNDHGDSDWLSIMVTVGDPITKNTQTLPAKLHHIEGDIKTGNVIGGPFATDPFTANDSDVVSITYVLMNLGSSDAEEQFAQAVKVTDKIVQVVGPVAGAIIGTFFGATGEGFQVGEQIAKGVDEAISKLGDLFDVLGIHIGPPNCNGEVLHDSLTFQPGELEKAINQSSSREYTGPQTNSRCGGAPQSRVHFSIVHDVPSGGLFPSVIDQQLVPVA